MTMQKFRTKEGKFIVGCVAVLGTLLLVNVAGQAEQYVRQYLRERNPPRTVRATPLPYTPGTEQELDYRIKRKEWQEVAKFVRQHMDEPYVQRRRSELYGMMEQHVDKHADRRRLFSDCEYFYDFARVMAGLNESKAEKFQQAHEEHSKKYCCVRLVSFSRE